MSQNKKESSIEEMQQTIEIRNTSELRVASFNEQTGKLIYENVHIPEGEFLIYHQAGSYTEPTKIFGTNKPCPIEYSENLPFPRPIFILENSKDDHEKEKRQFQSRQLRQSKSQLASWLNDQDNFDTMVGVNYHFNQGQNALDKAREYEEKYGPELALKISESLTEIEEKAKEYVIKPKK